MPLGCLREYVSKNKKDIGSKPLLNWCTQIARGMAFLEDRKVVHRDLAARNVLVHTPNNVKITDFGLAKLLEPSELEYKDTGGKKPIKWLALECILHRVFTHKSDVWAYGVTVWELFTFGEISPYKDVAPRDLPELLKVGERLQQPRCVSLNVWMVVLKCFKAVPEERPSFKVLQETFATFASDPGRYLSIENDEHMRLPMFSTHDQKDWLKKLSLEHGVSSEIFMQADEYLNPNKMASQNTLSTPVDTPLPPATPTQKFFPSTLALHNGGGHLSNRNSTILPSQSRHSRYASSITVNQPGFSTMGSKSLNRHSTFSASVDPLGKTIL